MSTPVLVAVAWPYASGSRHLGHLAGAYLPADVFARHQRIVGNEVLMVSGSDVHGTPITVRADAEGVAPKEIVDRYHGEFLRQWDEFGMAWVAEDLTAGETDFGETEVLEIRKSLDLTGVPASWPLVMTDVPAAIVSW